MARIIKETIVRQDVPVRQTVVTPVKVEATTYQTIEYLIYFFFGALEILLVLRFVFKLAGASMASAFIRFIYGITNIFVWPFEGIFRKSLAQGVETTSVFEPSTVVAILVYALLTWGVIALVRVFSGEQQVE